MLKVPGILFCIFSFASAAGELTVTPASPDGQDWLVFQLSNPGHNCCTIYHNLHTSLTDTGIYLSYEVEGAINACDCPSGAEVSFSSPPLYPEIYQVFQVEVPYCDTEPYPEVRPLPVQVGEVMVTDPSGDETYRLERSGYACLTEPCGHIRAVNQETGDTTMAAAVRDTSGQYACLACRMIIPWLDEVLAVRGYFYTDSLEGWITRGASFAITEIVSGASSSDSLVIRPQQPTVSDSIGFNLFMEILSCCTDWNSDSVTVSHNRITLYYSQPLVDCMCVAFWHMSRADYIIGPAPPGAYSIFKQENPSCLGTPCPEPTEPPVLLGEMTVIDPTPVLLPQTHADKSIMEITPGSINRELEIGFSRIQKGPITLLLYDQSGRLIQSWKFRDSRKELISLKGHSPGLYILRTRNNGREYSRKIIIQN
ncbi:T9SS type A sorting domain-containing protein [Fibrobacterota bacterium]